MFGWNLFKKSQSKTQEVLSTDTSQDSFDDDHHKNPESFFQLNHEENRSNCCFLSISMTVEKYDSDELLSLARDIFYDVQGKYPNVELELTDHKNDRYLIGGDTYIKIPVVNKGEVDFDCVFETIQKLKEESDNKKFKKKYFAYIFKIIQEGHLGEGFEQMTMDYWSDKVRPFYSDKVFPQYNSNLYTYMPEGKLPSWKIKGPLKGNNVKLLNDAYKYAQDFISKYWELKKRK